MNIHRIVREFLFIVFALYFAQDWLYTSGSLLSQLCIVIIILISGVYLMKTLFMNDRKNLFFIAWTLFIILNLTRFIFQFDLSAGPARDAIKNTLGCMLPFYPFYYFTRKGELKEKQLIRFALLILPVFIFRFLVNQRTYMTTFDRDANEVVNNLAYAFTGLIPYVFLIKNKRLPSGAFMLVILLFVIQGSKRGAIIAASIGLILYFYYQIIISEKRYRITNYVSAFIIIILLSTFAYRTVISNEFVLDRMTSMMQGGTSNRTYLYTIIFRNWYAGNNLLNLLFGYGLAGSIVLTGGGLAHNDWLEILSNFGLIGIFSYIFLFYSAVKTALAKEWLLDKKIVMLTMVSMWFFITLISMWYTSLDYFTNAILFGYLMGNFSRNLISPSSNENTLCN